MVGPSSDTVRPDADRLLLDVMLGKLAVYLRICGYDTAYAGDRSIEDDDRIASLAIEENRTLLTRDVDLAARVDGSVLVTERDVDDQLAELDRAGFELEIAEVPSNCGRCNGPLDPVSSDYDTPDYAPDPSTTECWRCRSCGQLFWKGSHYERMEESIANLADADR